MIPSFHKFAENPMGSVFSLTMVVQNNPSDDNWDRSDLGWKPTIPKVHSCFYCLVDRKKTAV